MEEYRKVCSLQEHKILEQAHETLIGSGFNADRVTIVDAGHYVHLEQPDAFAQAVAAFGKSQGAA